MLRSWNDGAALAAVREFVARVTTEGSPEFLPPAERVAVFDNDGTLWCEKPMPIELGFILQRLAAMATQDPALRVRGHGRGDRDFMRPVTERIYGIPAERVIGSTNSPAGRPGPGCRCWCCTTTPSASSTTWPGPSGRWRRPRPGTGRW